MKFINQQLIKDTNMKHLYTSIYHNPGISRAHLSKQTALSKTTVSTLIDELIERNFILDPAQRAGNPISSTSAATAISLWFSTGTRTGFIPIW